MGWRGDGGPDFPGGARRLAADQRLIDFLDLARGELFRQGDVGLVVFGDDEAAAGFLVEAVDNAGAGHAADAAKRALAVVQKGVDQRVLLVSGSGVHDDAGGLVQDEQRFVLVQNLKRDFFRLGPGGFGLRPVDLDLVAGVRALRGLDPQAVDEDVAFLDEPLQRAARSGGEPFAQEFVQPRGGQGFFDDEAFRALAHAVVCAGEWGEVSLFQVIRKTRATPVQMAESATLKAGKPSSRPSRCCR